MDQEKNSGFADAFQDQCQVESKFKMTCAGCNRTFCKKTNFEQHFFCPWRCGNRSRRRLRDALDIVPLAYTGSLPIYTAEEYANHMDRKHARRGMFPNAWRKALNIFCSFNRNIQKNIYYYSSSKVAPYLIKIILASNKET